MFYHITPRENKESILKKGLSPLVLPYVFLAASFYEAFLLAPVTGGYCLAYNLQAKSQESKFAIYYDWSIAYVDISLFIISPRELAIKHHENGDIFYYERFLKIACSDANRTVYEYITDRVPTKNIISVKDYALPYPVMKSTNDVGPRIKEYKKLLQQYPQQEVISMMRNKYVACPKIFIPNNNKS